MAVGAGVIDPLRAHAMVVHGGVSRMKGLPPTTFGVFV
jgi:hypothetical protein